MGYFHKQNVFLDSSIYLIILCGIALIVLLPIWLFGSGVSDFTCFRDSEGVECSLVRTSQFFKIADVKIHHPIAADITQFEIGSKGTFTYRVDIRSENTSYKTNIYYGYDYKISHAVANEINEFLITSKAPSFYKRF